MKIVIVDYGMGNIKSIISALNFVGVSDITVSGEYSKLKQADKLILPGVGSFSKAMHLINERTLDVYLNEIVLEDKKPILGICLGMQLMGESSDENGMNAGLSFVNAQVRRFQLDNLKVPHVGFNQVQIVEESRLYCGLDQNPDFYFVHSYHMQSEQKINQSFSNYGNKFIASFEYGNIAGVQFHPELSQRNGLTLMKNFVDKF
jgi:glutamine amidotransferase